MQNASVHTYSQSSFSLSTPCCIYNKLLLSLLVIHCKKTRRNIGSKTNRDATLDSIPEYAISARPVIEKADL